MAQLTREDVLKLAKLARIDLTEAEIEEYAAEFSAILQYVELLQSADIDGLEPTTQVTGLTNVMWPDVVRSYGYVPQDLLPNVPAFQDGHIKVKRMVG